MVKTFHAWGLTLESVWVKVSSYGDAAETFHDFVKDMGQDFCHCRFSALRHLRKIGNTGGDYGVYAFKVEEGCLYEVDDSHCAKLKQAPSPTIRTSFVDFQGMQDTDDDNDDDDDDKDDDNDYDDDDDDEFDDDNDEYDSEDVSVMMTMTLTMTMMMMLMMMMKDYGDGDDDDDDDDDADVNNFCTFPGQCPLFYLGQNP